MKFGSVDRNRKTKFMEFLTASKIHRFNFFEKIMIDDILIRKITK